MEIIVQRTIVVPEPAVDPCGVEVYIDDKYGPCPGSGIIPLTMGCVHEHVDDLMVCAMHAQRAYAGELWCRQCHINDPPHTCELRVS